MDIYFKKRRWKQLILIFAVLIGIGSLMYTNDLVKQSSEEERIKIERWADAIKIIADNKKHETEIYNFLTHITEANNTTPIILIEENGDINLDRNIKYTPKNRDKVLAKELAKMKAKQEPIVIHLVDDVYQYLYYKESSFLVKLRFYPIIQLIITIIFILIAYVSFSSARKSEQNLVWIGMAKETAHQLGTPISSLIAWIELLKEENLDPKIISELEKDAERLEKITERFSKIGSVPELYNENLYSVLSTTFGYLQPRVSKKIEFVFNYTQSNELYIPLSPSLFTWVIENLVRNAVDAIENNTGKIIVDVIEKEKEVTIDITDNGKGIPKSKFRTIFQPGYTTKKRGWGLGLSLSKRIIEIYHNGKIFIRNSEPHKATTFRIILKK